MFIGPYINGIAVLVCGLIDVFLGRKHPKRIKTN